MRTSRLLLAWAMALFCSSVQAEMPDDPYFSTPPGWALTTEPQWGLKTIGFTDIADKNSAWHYSDGRDVPVVVAVIDTGLDYFHPDIAPSNIWHNPDERANGKDDDGNGYIDDLIGWNFIGNNNNPSDNAGHGTHVAGIIGAATNNGEGIAGINWGVKLMPLKVLNFVGRGRSIGIAEAIYYAVAKGARVINLSLGGEHLSTIERVAVNYAVKKSVLVVVAAGNEAINTEDYGPAGLNQVITVGAIGPDGRHANFSNWGAAVDIVAPGVDILSLRARRTDFALIAGQVGYQAGAAFVGEGNKYYLATGTSFAAPFVSGVASLIIAKHPQLTVHQVRNVLLQSARDIGTPGIDQYSGYGLLDARAALSADPGFFITVEISAVTVIQKKGRPWIHVTGSADSDHLSEAWIEIGSGDAPQQWTRVSRRIKKPVQSGVLDDLDVNAFRSAKKWTLRLICKHKNGRTREARFVLNLG